MLGCLKTEREEDRKWLAQGESDAIAHNSRSIASLSNTDSGSGRVVG
jgi:hypothetical protein